MKNRKDHHDMIRFIVPLLTFFIVFIIGLIQTNSFNSTVHRETISGEVLFSTEAGTGKGLSLRAAPRSSTWSKAFDLYDEGITEHNYQAYTYDFRIKNSSSNEIADFEFVLYFDKEIFLLSAWNGSLKIHQNVKENEYMAVVPDLREFRAQDYSFDTVTFDGVTLIRMNPGDYLEYIPSSDENAMEVPLEPFEVTVPGMILYAPIGEEIDGWTVDLQYRYNKKVTKDLFFWVSLTGLLGLIAINLITSVQIKKYKLRHEHDNEMIRESIETFTGFIDAKDPYTKGHSGRVAAYTKAIAREMGYSGEELDRIYYIALLHDCGKMGVPDSILKKPDKLNDEEFEVIKSHTVCGGEILSSFRSLENAGEGALYHHERYDGTGYPEGRAGEDIPLIARMICVADSFDAMNSNRVYRKKLTPEMIREEIEKNRGKQFDPKIADLFLKLLEEGRVTLGG